MTATSVDPVLLGHELAVRDVVRETADAVSIIFDVPAELAERFVHRPGQFLTLAVPSERTGRVARCYSLSSAPGDAPMVTVKRTPDGYASGWLCAHLRPGATLRVLPPAGTFVPHDLGASMVLAAAGSGITPMLSIVRATLAVPGGRLTLLYANRDAASVIFADVLDELAAAHPDRLEVRHWLESERGLPTADGLADLAGPTGEQPWYLCGPAPFMAVAQQAAVACGAAPRAVHQEDFHSLVGDPFTLAVAEPAADGDDAAELEVTLDGRTHLLRWGRSETLVDVMLANGVEAPYSCREGTCGSCMCTVVDGEVVQASTEALAEEDIEDGYVLGCQSRPLGARVVVEFD
ncbi:ferredoxin--NADP reductase [Nocardioides zeae]|uniref:Ferredoxin--NADP reductase n=1 Tax=Nocardioides zeae TaxID=1457234 RepID=A0A6P0HMK6_9ACTN|nr:ferredoxin--NADP reductase [Nocardioides zeae]NEN79826.1 ferredoxin--NADP reductase [Nocardioides zeae]